MFVLVLRFVPVAFQVRFRFLKKKKENLELQEKKEYSTVIAFLVMMRGGKEKKWKATSYRARKEQMLKMDIQVYNFVVTLQKHSVKSEVVHPFLQQLTTMNLY